MTLNARAVTFPALTCHRLHLFSAPPLPVPLPEHPEALDNNCLESSWSYETPFEQHGGFRPGSAVASFRSIAAPGALLSPLAGAHLQCSIQLASGLVVSNLRGVPRGVRVKMVRQRVYKVGLESCSSHMLRWWKPQRLSRLGDLHCSIGETVGCTSEQARHILLDGGFKSIGWRTRSHSAIQLTDHGALKSNYFCGCPIHPHLIHETQEANLKFIWPLRMLRAACFVAFDKRPTRKS